MPSAASNYLENKLLDHVLCTASYTQPTNVWLALFTSDPGEDASGTEVSTSGTGYGRKNINVDGSSGAFNAASLGSTSNTQTITFTTATANWNTITHVAIFDAETGGNMLFYGGVTTSKTIETGDTFQVSSGNLTITLD